MKEVRSPYIPAGQRPMRSLRTMLRSIGMFLTMGPAEPRPKFKRKEHVPGASKVSVRTKASHAPAPVQRKAWHERP